MRRNTSKLGFAAVLAGAVALTACAGTAEESGGDGVVEAVSVYCNTFSQDYGNTEGCFEVVNNTHAGLIRNPYIASDEDPGALTQDLYDWEPWLAESYDISDDGLVYTFHLRDDVVSQAGNPLTADDVLYTFERRWSVNEHLEARPAVSDPSTQFAKVDDHTITITIENANYGFHLLSWLSKGFGYIYDSTLLKEHASDEDPYAIEWSGQNGNFSFGAYNVASYQKGEEIVLEANPDYVLGEPEIKRVTLRVVADAATRSLMLQNGEVDSANELRPADLEALSTTDGVSVYNPATNAYTTAFVNVTSPKLEDVKVREAFSYAIPYDEILDKVYYGRANEVVGYLDPKLPNRKLDGLDERSFDPERSLELLEEAGVETPLKLEMIMNNSQPDFEETAVQMQSAAADAGFDLEINNVAQGTADDRRDAKDFDIYIARVFVQANESAPYALRLLNSDDFLNWSGWQSDEFNDVVQEGIDIGDQNTEEAAALWNEAEQIWQNSYSMIHIANVPTGYAFRSDLTGFNQRMTLDMDWSVVGRE